MVSQTSDVLVQDVGERGTKPWLVEVNGKIGGSSCAEATGIARPFPGSPRIHNRLRAAWAGEPLDSGVDENSPDIRRGTFSEPGHVQQLVEAGIVSIGAGMWGQSRFVSNVQYPWANCLPDVWDETKGYGVELKAPRPGRLAEMRVTGGIRQEYIMQAQHCMAVTGAERWVVSLWDCIAYRPYYYWLDRDQGLIDDMMAKEKEVWDYAKEHEDPPPDPFADQDEPLEEFADTDETFRMLSDPKAIELAVQMLEIRQLRGEIGKAYESATVELVQHFGMNIHVGQVPGVLRFYNRPTKPRATFDKNGCLKKFPEAIEFVGEGKPSRPFKPYPLGDYKERFAVPKE